MWITTPKKAFSALHRFSPYNCFPSPKTPVSSPGGHSLPPDTPLASRLSSPPPPRKRYRAPGGPPLRAHNPPAVRYAPVGKGFRRFRRAPSRQSLRKDRSLRSIERTSASPNTQDSNQLANLTKAAFAAVEQANIPLNSEDCIFIQQLKKLAPKRDINDILIEAREAVERAAELAPILNAERDAQSKLSLERDRARERVAEPKRRANFANEGRPARTAFKQQDRLDADIKYKIAFHAQEEARRAQQQRQAQARRDADAAKERQREEEGRRRQEMWEQQERARHAMEQQFREQAEAEMRMGEERARVEREHLARAHEEAARLREEMERRSRFAAMRAQWDANMRTDSGAQFQQTYVAPEFDHFHRQPQPDCHPQPQQFTPQFQQFNNHHQEVPPQYSQQPASELPHEFQAVPDEDVSMSYESFRVDTDASMRTAASYSTRSSRSPSPVPPPPQTDAEKYLLYERKWDALKSYTALLAFNQLPWPVLQNVFTPAEITQELLAEFFFNPTRPGNENKSKKELARSELLRWHPDKFAGKILGRIFPEDHPVVLEAVGVIARFLIDVSKSTGA